MILYNCFMEGEQTHKKVSPEEAEAIIREKLTPKDYVTPQQIRGLFSRWSKNLQEGKLKPPKEKKLERRRKDVMTTAATRKQMSLMNVLMLMLTKEQLHIMTFSAMLSTDAVHNGKLMTGLL